MPDLPSIALRAPANATPTPGVSPGQIAEPFNELAATLDKAGEAANTAAIELATQAGHQAVTRDDNGELTIRRPTLPLIGDAAPAFARAARFDYIAQRQPEIENHATDLRLKFPGDPAAFQKAWDTFGKEFLAKEQDPLIKAPLANSIAHVGGQAYREAQIQSNALTVASTVQSLQARLIRINEEGASLARQGGVDTLEYGRIHQQRAAIYQELTSNPLYRYSKERADAELKDNRDADIGQAIVGEGVKQFRTRQNIAEAQKWFDDKVWGPGSEKLNLTPAKRDHIIAEGLKALQRVSVEDRVEVQAFRSAVQSYTGQLAHDPYLFNDIKHNELLARADELGDYRTRQQLESSKLLVPVMQTIKSLPPAEKNAALLQIARGTVPMVPGLLTSPLGGEVKVTSTFGARPAPMPGASTMHGGVDLEAPVGTAVMASGPGTVLRAGPEKGYGNLVEIDHGNGTITRYAHLGNIGVKPGDQVPAGAQIGAAGATGTTTGPHLHFEVLQGGRPVDPTQLLSGGLVPGQSVYSIRNPYAAKQWEQFTKEITTETGRNAEHLATQIDAMVRRGDGILPETIETFVASAVSAGKPDLIDKVRPLLEAYDAKQSMPSGRGAVAVLQANIASAKAAGVNPMQAAALTELGKMVEHDAKLWNDAPLIAGAQAQTITPVRPINAQNPQAAAAEFADRQRKITLLQHPAGHALGPTSALADKNEGEALKAALTQGPVDGAAGLLTGMQQTLKLDTFKATMASEPMKEALSGMIRSRDPARMAAGFGTLDQLWQMDHWGFKAAFGEANLTHLQAWQGLKNSFSPAELAERLNASEDPSTVKAREHLTEEAKKESASWKAADVAYQIGSSWGVPVLSWLVNPLTGATADAPALEGEGLKLVEDFRSTYSALRTYSVDPENAKKLAAQRVRSEWGPTNVGGVVNTLMKHPPDAKTTDPASGVARGAFYPMIDGSHDWMRKDLYDNIAAIKGPQKTARVEAATLGMAIDRTNWNFVGLTSDPQTEAEIGQGKPPSYQVWITNRDGALELLRDAKTGQNRFRWDAQAHVQKAQKEFGELVGQRAFDAAITPPFAWRSPPVGDL